MKPKTTYAVFYKMAPTDYEPSPDWKQYNEWVENLEFARKYLSCAKKNSRFVECKIVERTETFSDFGSETPLCIVESEELGSIIVCAVRYACGRKTYMPSIVCGFITPLIPSLTNKTLSVICGDIVSAAEHGGLGDAMIDAPLWRKLHHACSDELKQRGR